MSLFPDIPFLHPVEITPFYRRLLAFQLGKEAVEMPDAKIQNSVYNDKSGFLSLSARLAPIQ